MYHYPSPYLFVFGTRPEAIKLAPLIRVFQQSAIPIQVCVTGQHREMLDQILTFFEIVPDVDLKLMTANQSINKLAALILNSIDEVYVRYKPGMVLVHGDTTTSSAAAWAAFHRGIKVAHVEAGLRTHNKQAPFPEEINRQITSRIADIHFAPTEISRNNLLSEGISSDSIFITGNTVVDALQIGLDKLEKGYKDAEIVTLDALIDPKKRIILVTGHRRENFGDSLIEICEGLKMIASLENVQVIYPVHLNPNILAPVHEAIGNVKGIELIPPLGYPAFIYLMNKAFFILTDSGGVQEEAPSLEKPILVMRTTTERPEAIQSGIAKLVGYNRYDIFKEAFELLSNPEYYGWRSKATNPYGDGKASQRILNILNP